MAADNPPAGGGIDDVFPTWWKNNIRVCPVASLADGGGGGATKAKQEAAPHRMSSESTAPVPQRGTRRASTSRLRRRRASFPRNTPTPSGRTTSAISRRTCWASPSYLRRRCSLPLPPAPYCRRCQGKAATGFQWGRPEPGCSGNTSPRDAGAINHRGAAYPGRAEESPRGCRGPMG
jgi:hypothetical protein